MVGEDDGSLAKTMKKPPAPPSPFERTIALEDVDDLVTPAAPPSARPAWPWASPPPAPARPAVAPRTSPGDGGNRFDQTIATDGPPPLPDAAPFALARGAAPPSSPPQTIAGAPWASRPAPAVPRPQPGVTETVDLEAAMRDLRAASDPPNPPPVPAEPPPSFPPARSPTEVDRAAAAREVEEQRRAAEARLVQERRRFEEEQRERAAREAESRARRAKLRVMPHLASSAYGGFKDD
ncbi:MAG: hypothetical protein R3B72_17910 [Polyangiaceae bacterium]